MSFRFTLLTTSLFTLFLLTACSDSDTPQSTQSAQPTLEVESPPVQEQAASDAEAAEDTVPAEPAVEVVSTAESVTAQMNETVTETAQAVVTDVEVIKEEVVVKAETALADITDPGKPYQLVDGKISANAMEGWKTYNGGGCGACHGKGGVGAVGPNLAVSVTEKLSRDEFYNVVTNGRSGTMMRPHKTNKRVMDNLDNLYAYLLARGDGVLGPGNLIKSPLGK